MTQTAAIAAIGRRRVSAATHRLMESYKDDYPSHAKGILQEAIQNSIDARIAHASFKDVTIVIEYDPNARELRIRDYGTTGMPHCSNCTWGVKPTGEDCHEEGCNWGNFHYLGGLAKTADQLGSRGQGKSLAITAGKSLVVRTKTFGSEHISMASKWSRDGDDWYWDRMRELGMATTDKPGSELIITGVNDEVHDQLKDSKSVRADVASTWFKAIDKGVRIRYGFKGEELAVISSPSFPKPSKVEGGTATRRRNSMPVTINRKVVGELVDLELFLADETVSEGLRGVAFVRNGTQVIERLSNWGRKLPIEIQDRLYGWVTYHTTDAKPFLRDCEKPGHRGFQLHPYYRKTKEILQQQVEEFGLPFAKKQLRPKLTEKDRDRASQNLSIIQGALADVPEFNPWSTEETGPAETKTRLVPANPYISEITLDKEFYARGETATARITVLNPTNAHQPFIHVILQALDPSLGELQVQDFPPTSLPTLLASSEEKKGRVQIETQTLVTNDFAAGRNWLRCTLLNKPPVDGTSVQWDRSSKALWVDVAPGKDKRNGVKGRARTNQGNSGSLGNLVPVTDDELDPDEQELIALWTDAELWFNTRGRRMVVVYESEPRTADSILYELIAESIAERVIERAMTEDARETLDKSQVVDEFRRIEELRRRFLRSCERRRGAAE